jgi:hypothetical protein
MSTNCIHEVQEQKIKDYNAEALLGIDGVILHDAVVETRCTLCNALDSVIIPNVQGLIAAVAVSRVMIPLKLRGKEIRFLRKAVELSPEELSNTVDVRADGISRWENDKEVINSRSEKLLRLFVGKKLAHLTAIKFDADAIFSMKFRAWRSLQHPLEMHFVLNKRQADVQWKAAA